MIVRVNTATVWQNHTVPALHWSFIPSDVSINTTWMTDDLHQHCFKVPLCKEVDLGVYFPNLWEDGRPFLQAQTHL